MKMRPGDASRGAGQADDLISLDHGSFFYVDARQVRIERVDAQTMIDDYGISGEEQILCQRDASAVRGVNGRTCARLEIGAIMRVARLAVEHAPMTEVRARLSCNRRLKRSRPQN